MSIDVNTAAVFSDPDTGFELKPLGAENDATAAAILAPAIEGGTTEQARDRIAQARTGGADRVIGGWLDGSLVATYTIVRDGMANHVGLIGVAPDFRLRGFGKMMLMDALRRSGRRPLTTESDEDHLEFFKACGFKLVGRRKQPDGRFRYRVGWHAPRGGSRGAETC